MPGSNVQIPVGRTTSVSPETALLGLVFTLGPRLTEASQMTPRLSSSSSSFSFSPSLSLLFQLGPET